MVEYVPPLDEVFGSLADPTRRDILRRVTGAELSVGEIARFYDLTFAAVSKHLKILEKAQLIRKRKAGKERMVSLAPGALQSADEYLEQYRQTWQSRYYKLERLLEEE
jgi:DNA-binding transcriptional ArsR family regulator